MTTPTLTKTMEAMANQPIPEVDPTSFQLAERDALEARAEDAESSAEHWRDAYEAERSLSQRDDLMTMIWSIGVSLAFVSLLLAFAYAQSAKMFNARDKADSHD